MTSKTIQNWLAVASGKGGVGKSTVALNLALAFSKQGLSVGLLDADIYGPSLPTMAQIHEKPFVRGKMLLPVEKMGLKMMSMGFLATDEAPVIWRGPMVSGILQQFLTQVEWGPLDMLVIDLPPGTGDAQLTLTQQAPLSGAVIVTTPQEVSLADAKRGLKMFQKVNVPVLGIVENMSYFICDQCAKRHPIFLQAGGKRVAEELGIPLLGEIPLDPEVAAGGDSGKPIVTEKPESPAARVFFTVAARLLETLAPGKQIPERELYLKW